MYSNILLQTLLWCIFSTLVCSIPTGKHAKVPSDQLVQELSLPEIYNLKKIPSTFQTDGDALLEEGRIVLTPKPNTKGSLWLKSKYVFDGAFTIEWSFRSFDFVGQSSGGLSFWFIDDSINTNKNKDLYNGPAKFSGLQILLDNNGPLGPALRAQLNDGEQTFDKTTISKNTFASCLIGYQDTSVPSTLRVTYDTKDNNLLKVQVDNRICFQTRKLKLIKPSQKVTSLQFGVSSDNGKDNKESFEILKMNLFKGVTDQSMIPNVHSMEQPKVLTRMVDSTTGETKIVDIEKFKAEKDDKVTNYDLYKKLDRVEGKILANDVRSMDSRLQEILEIQGDLIKYTEHILSIIGKNTNGDSIQSDDKFKDFLSMNDKLDTVLSQQEKIREATRTQQNLNAVGPHPDEIVSRLIMWLIPLGIIMSVMAYYTFKINQEIYKAKLL